MFHAASMEILQTDSAAGPMCGVKKVFSTSCMDNYDQSTDELLQPRFEMVTIVLPGYTAMQLPEGET